MNVRPKMDQVDVRILKTLLKNPRTSFRKIAKDCKLSSNSIRLRFERLKEVGIITGAVMQVNPKSLGYDCIAFLGIQADPVKKKIVCDFLEKMPNIIQSIQPMGRYNIFSFVAINSVDELAQIVEQVGNHPEVWNVEACIWVDVTKMDRPENLEIKEYEGS